MISTLVFGKIIPSTSLALDGSARTLTCVEVTPSAGETVDVIEGGRGVSVGLEGSVGNRVSVRMKGVGEVVVVWLVFVAQLLIASAIKITGTMFFEVTK